MGHRPRTWVLATACCLFVIAMFASCKSSEKNGTASQSGTADAKTTTGTITSHWVQDKRLREVMAELSKKNPNWPAGIPQEPESQQLPKNEDFDEVAQLANSLMLSAERIPDVASKIKMNEADREGFLAQARVLREQAKRLRDSARHHKIEQMQENMAWLNSTCLSCHSRYRDFSGQLDSTRVSISPE
jgi:hypothetical protein